MYAFMNIGCKAHANRADGSIYEINYKSKGVYLVHACSHWYTARLLA